MHLRRPQLHPSRQRASTLIVVIVTTVVVALVTGSLLKYGLTEARLNQSDQLYGEARLAAEAALHHGMAQLRGRFDRTAQLAPSELVPSRTSSLELGPGMLARLGQTRAVVPATYTRPATLADFHQTPTVLGAVLVNGGEPTSLRIDPFTLLPEQDAPGIPTDARVREVRLYAKATVRDSRMGERVCYARQTFQVIDRSIFQNTVFYNGLLEIFPGAGFDLGMGGGPIYADHIHIGGGPRIHTRVETSGDFKIGRYHSDADTGSSAQLSDMRLIGDNSTTNTSGGTNYLKDLKKIIDPTRSGTAIQTGVEGFRELALQGYNGGLLTSEHGIVDQAAVGMDFLRDLAIEEAASDAYLTADGRFDQGKFDRDGGNFGHLLIEPSRGLVDTSTIHDEAQRSREEAFNEIERTKWANRSTLVVELDPTTDSVRLYHQPTDDADPRFDASGTRVRQRIDIDDAFPSPSTRFWSVERFQRTGGSTNDVTSGLYDYRQAAGKTNDATGKINLLRIDMSKMRKWVEQSWSDSELGEGGHRPSFDPDWWNGGVYVQLPETLPEARTDRVVPADPAWAVQLHSATTLPNRFVKDTQAAKGLTLATNGALYVQGTYNAPGGTTWDSGTYATEADAEVPAALVADAITLLSDNWSNIDSGRDFATRRATGTTHSAALVTGNVPSNSGKYSGGIENFPRYLEDWETSPRQTHTYRGSLIRLFRSESAKRAWGASNVYKVPARNWAFHTGYRTVAPPLEIGPRVFRRIGFKELTEAEFVSETATLYGAATAP